MKNIFLKIVVLTFTFLVTACAVTSAKQVYRIDGGDELMISDRMQAGNVDIYINGEHVIEDASILDFDEVFKGKYKNMDVKAQCKHTKHFFSTENECDVYVDGKYATNLYLR